MCILVVEDEPLILMVAAHSLEDDGHEVVTASHAPAAVELIEARPGIFTALVTDHNMPPHAMSGANLVVHMRQSYPAIPMILATAMDHLIGMEFRALHHLHVLPKPYEPFALVAMVNDLLGRTEARTS